MTEDIILNGINIDKAYDELYNVRAKIRQEASKYMSDNIDLAQSLTKQLSELKDVELINKVAIEAYNALINVKKVSEVSGVEYYLPYSSHNSLLSSYNNKSLVGVKIINELSDLFDEFETQTSRWNASYC